MPATDIHQHLWPDTLLTALASRREAPMILRTGRQWRLVARGEAPSVVDPIDHDPSRRADRAARDGIERVIVAPSCPIGIECLPAREGIPLLDAYHSGIAALGAPFRGWAATSLTAPDPTALDDHLASGFVGLCLPAGAVTTPAGAERVAPLLAALDRRAAPLFVHPGPSPWDPAPEVPRRAPAWWTPLTSYVSQMQRAWFVVNEVVRPQFPGLRICFAMLAGLAPLHDDRLRGRGGPGFAPDGATYLEVSSYGPDVVAMVERIVGEAAIVFGSDAPVVDARQPDHSSAARARTITAQLIEGVAAT
jgi:hypothetical protein